MSETRATLNGVIDTEGFEAWYGFEYGTKEGSNVGTQGKFIKKGQFSPVAVSESIEGLTPNTTYYFRIAAYVASGGGGKILFGKYQTFKTPAAQIPSLQAERYTAAVSGKQVAGDPIVFRAGEAAAQCSSASFSASLPSMAAIVPLNGTFSGCTFLGEAATVSMNSCRLVLRISDGPPYVGTSSIRCAKANDGITINTAACNVKIPAQEPGGTVAYQNNGEGSSRTVSADISATGVQYQHVSGPLCFLVGKTGSIGGTVTLAATEGGTANGLFIGGEGSSQSGVFVSNEGGQTQFAAESYPEAILAERDIGDKVVVFASGGAEAVCETAGWSGTLAAASTSLPLNATFSGCTFLGEPATVSMTGCKYVLNVSNGGPPYTGSPGISCEAGGAIGVSTPSCSVSIPTQTLSGGASYSNEGSGSKRAINVDVAATNVNYLKSGPLCFLIGNGKDGAFSFGFRLYALK